MDHENRSPCDGGCLSRAWCRCAAQKSYVESAFGTSKEPVENFLTAFSTLIASRVYFYYDGSSPTSRDLCLYVRWDEARRGRNNNASRRPVDKKLIPFGTEVSCVVVASASLVTTSSCLREIGSEIAIYVGLVDLSLITDNKRPSDLVQHEAKYSRLLLLSACLQSAVAIGSRRKKNHRTYH
ncbi:hypothetical protein CBL_07117 [Carabus blaptoides fortunei]